MTHPEQAVANFDTGLNCAQSVCAAFAEDFGDWNIRVNNIAPGYIYTNMTRKSFNDIALNTQRASNTMLKRWGMPTDLAGAVIFLASQASSYITGIDLYVDGGWTAKGLV